MSEKFCGRKKGRILSSFAGLAVCRLQKFYPKWQSIERETPLGLYTHLAFRMEVKKAIIEFNENLLKLKSTESAGGGGGENFHAII